MPKLKKGEPGITAWSFSRLNDYRKCPAYCYYKHILKMKEPGSKAMDRGSVIDQMASDFIGGKLKVCPPELMHFKSEFTKLRKGGGAVLQEQWCFNVTWRETGWFDQDAWLRLKTDVYRVNPKTGVVLIVDNKTGKVRIEHEEQVQLYALCALLKFEQVLAVDARIWYLDHGTEKPDEERLYIQADVPRLKAYWLEQAGPMLSAKNFEETPSAACSWCHFSKAKDGPCRF